MVSVGTISLVWVVNDELQTWRRMSAGGWVNMTFGGLWAWGKDCGFGGGFLRLTQKGKICTSKQ